METREELKAEIRRLRREVARLKKLESGRTGEQDEDLQLKASIFGNASEGILITDERGTIQSVNPAFSEITGYSAEEAIGKTPRLLKSHMHKADFYGEMWRSLTDRKKWQGEIWNRRKSGEVFPVWMNISAILDEEGKTTHYIGIFDDMTVRDQMYDSLRHKAYHDALTGLPNRLLFMDRLDVALASAARNRKLLAVMFIDLNDFKKVNDRYGHLIGDQLLDQIGARFVRCVRKEDTVARIGGDEFTVLMPHVNDPEDSQKVSQKILVALSVPFFIEGHEIVISASIGLSIFPEDGDNPVTLLKNADLDMYRIKDAGKTNFNPSLGLTSITTPLETEQETP